MFEQFKNPDGTYNGAKALSSLSGISEKEIIWMAARLKQLIQVDGMSKAEAKAKVLLESKARPWEKE